MKMQPFPSIVLSKLKHDQMLHLSDYAVTIWKDAPTIPHTIELLLADLTEAHDTLNKILHKERGSELTQEINNRDDARDKGYSILCRTIQDACDDFDEDLISAGETLLPIIERFPASLTDASGAVESANLETALAEFAKPEYAAAIEALNLNRVLTWIRKNTEEFEQFTHERIELKVAKEKLPPIRAHRRSMEKKLGLLLKITEYLFTTDRESYPHDHFGTLHIQIRDTSALIKRRETIANSSKDEMTTVSDTTGEAESSMTTVSQE